MKPRIMKSSLTNPPQWYVVTRYTEKRGIDAKTGKEYAYLVASRKYDVTDQMEAILASQRAVAKQERNTAGVTGRPAKGKK